MNKLYKVYSYYRMLHIVDVVPTLDEAVDAIEKVIYKEDSHYMIVEYNIDTNTETIIKCIRSIENFIEYKEQVKKNKPDKPKFKKKK